MVNPENEAMAHVFALQRAYPRLFDKGSPLGVWYPKGWDHTLHQLCGAIDALLDDGQTKLFRVDQVKEKFGTLRFYYSVAGQTKLTVDVLLPEQHLRAANSPKYRTGFPADAIDDLIREAEAATRTACAKCGKPGVLRTRGWHHVACDECEAKRPGGVGG